MLDYLIHCPSELYSDTAIILLAVCIVFMFLQRLADKNKSEAVSMTLVALVCIDWVILIALFLFWLCAWEGPIA